MKYQCYVAYVVIASIFPFGIFIMIYAINGFEFLSNTSLTYKIIYAIDNPQVHYKFMLLSNWESIFLSIFQDLSNRKCTF